MSILRMEFYGGFVDGTFPPSPISALSLSLSATPTPVGQQPVVPSNPAHPNEVFARIRADRPAYVLIANRPNLSAVSSGFIVVPGQVLTLRAFPGQRVAAVQADDFGTFSQAQVDALVAAASTAPSISPSPAATSGALDFSSSTNSGLLAALGA